ncbi:unnamed protein product [Triticum turgidum subsp. durum]|uniref:NAD(P)H dehydrogenase (quinone) n=1 Tax=Triticum turgidum subsp. durum TaxID=4567 RepID=A0A9R1A7X7_TRITD|nr:unnamed protein product [Triticum turgidum subsp. durum]
MATKIYIVGRSVLFSFIRRYYSTWGHVATLAEEIKKGADSVPGVEVTIWRVPETLPEDVLVKMHAAPGGGQESTALTAVTQLAHHGMLFVPVGGTHGAGMLIMDEVKGGSAYGAGTFAGADGGRVPTGAELALAEHQGKYFAGIAKKLKSV